VSIAPIINVRTIFWAAYFIGMLADPRRPYPCGGKTVIFRDFGGQPDYAANAATCIHSQSVFHLRLYLKHDFLNVIGLLAH
jgi:hypothetical protein